MPGVTKAFRFCYAHRILNHPGVCARLHGHGAKAEITVWGDLDEETGMVLDFGDLSDIAGAWIKNELDHNCILQVGDPLLESIDTKVVVLKGPPTAENIALLILEKCSNGLLGSDDRLIGVKMWETEDCWVEVP